ncbi:uncharacterized protein LOC113313687 isoform X2 [Papaver somniferum]|uniref:uncharacterized protein LOC113313687 isoform X2 n=1 Tax=Papaver somniferum TaxID=3469 RepID=UPI000E6F54A2|nr:uncharacterized protein LOC113313687 isoform X2 [Papaver somniferum]
MINIQALRNEGVPQSRIVKFLISRPSTLIISTVKFKDIVHEVKGMGFDHYKNTFLIAIIAITAMTKSTWESKLNAYRKWGWSEDEILNAFKIHPACMTFSEKKISTTTDYLVNQMGVSSLLIAKCPVILSYSLEKRIIPRISVHRILTDKGLMKDKISLYTILQMGRESFLDKFIIKFEQQAPELLKVKELS